MSKHQIIRNRSGLLTRAKAVLGGDWKVQACASF